MKSILIILLFTAGVCLAENPKNGRFGIYYLSWLTTPAPATAASSNSVTSTTTQSISANIFIGNRNNTTTDFIDYGTNLTNIMISIGKSVGLDLILNNNSNFRFLEEFPDEYSPNDVVDDEEATTQKSVSKNGFLRDISIPGWGGNSNSNNETLASLIPLIMAQQNNSFSQGLSNLIPQLQNLIPTGFRNSSSSLTNALSFSGYNGSSQNVPGVSDGIKQIFSMFLNGSNPIERMINNFIDVYRQQADEVIVNGTKYLNSALAPIQNFGDTMSEAMDLIGDNGIGGIIRVVSESGTKMTNCVRLEEFQQVGIAAMDSGRACVVNKINEIRDLINTTRSNLSNAIKDTETLRENMVRCQNKNYGEINQIVAMISRINCFGAALFNIQRETILLPITIATRIAQVDEIIQTARPYMLKCAANLAESMAGTAFDVGVDIGKCLTTDRNNNF